MAHSDTPALAAENLTCERGGRLLFAELSFSLAAGEVLVLRGANGSGKSSLLRIVAGLLTPDAGCVAWYGRETRDDPGPWRRALVFIGHDNAVKPAMTVRENLVFRNGLDGVTDDPGGPLAALGLDHLADMPVAMLSAGQRRRLALARLFGRPGGCWLLDEPTAALDAETSAGLARAIERHRQEGGVAVIATHDGIVSRDARVLDLGGAA